MRRVILVLICAAVLLAALISWLGAGETGFAAGRGALAVFLSVLIVGLPSLYDCCRRGLWEAWRFMLFGAASGLLSALPLYGGPYLFRFLLVLFVAAGAAGGALFWLAAIWRNRDLSCPKTLRLPDGTVYRVARTALVRQSK